jgi:hypothetical protein
MQKGRATDGKDTIMATSWAEAQRQALFKRVEGGFIFRVPGLSPRHYLVAEAQKDEINRLMRAPSKAISKRNVLIIILAIIGIVLLAVLLDVAFQLLSQWANGTDRSHSWFALICFYFTLIIAGPIRVVTMARSAQIGRVLEAAHQTEQRITLRDRNETYARLLPLSKLFAAAVACALGCALFAILVTGFKAGSFSLPPGPLTGWLAVVPLALLTVRFFYLVFLKLSLARST